MEFSAALARLGNNLGLLRELANVYLEDFPPLLTALREAAAASDSKEVARAAHSLRGLAATFDRQALVDSTLLVESAARHGSVAAAVSEHATIESLCNALADDLRRFVNVLPING